MGTNANENRCAIIRLNTVMIRQMLDLPDGYEVERIHAEYDPHGIVLVVSSGELEPAGRDTYLPTLEGQVTQTRIIDRDGKAYMRWGWQR